MRSYFCSKSSVAQSRTAVLVVNLGTPDAPTTSAVRRYLAEFLSDPRIVEQPRWLWLPILHGVILRIRPSRSARNYQEIWTDAGSPLQTGTQAIAAELAARLPDGVLVRHAMRYGSPSIASVMRELSAAGMQRLLVLPLFPQFSATTTASVLDAVSAELRQWRCPPELRFINEYHVQPQHIEALARSVEAHWQVHGRADRLMLSLHGIPQRYVDAGDPYRAQCEATVAALRTRLGGDPDSIMLCFQSRLGREPWLQPYADKTLQALPAQGVRSVDLLCPGFSVDCLETLEEVAITNRELFMQAGGERYHYIACLNAEADQMAALTALLTRHAQGWPEFEAQASQAAMLIE